MCGYFCIEGMCNDAKAKLRDVKLRCHKESRKSEKKLKKMCSYTIRVLLFNSLYSHHKFRI